MTDDKQPEAEAPAETPPKKAAPRKRAAAKPAPAATAADDDLLADAPPAKSGGGSSAVLAVIIIIIVAVLVAGVWWQRGVAREKERQDREARLAIAASQLATVQDRVAKALRDLDQAQPEVDRAIEALNGAGENLSVLAQGTSDIDEDSTLSKQLIGLQAEMRDAAQGLEQDRLAYEEAIEAARRDLKLATTRRVRPLASKLDTLVSATGRSAEMPIASPATTSGTAEEQPAAETEPEAEKPSAPATESEVGG